MELTYFNTAQIVPAKTVDADLFNKFINYLDTSPKTVQTYTRALKQLYKYFTDNGITQPQREDIISFRDHLKEYCKPTTVQSYLTATKLFFKWLEAEKLYPNVAENIKGAKISNEHKKDYLNSTQVKDILEHIDTSTPTGKRDFAIFVLTVTGGLRTIELHRALVEDIRTLGDATVLYIQGKGKEEKADYIKIHPPVEKAIRAYLKTREGVSGKDPLFTSLSNNSKGKTLSTRTISQIIKDCMVNAGYDSDALTAHSLRHTAVTLALLAGVELAEVQQFARHENISTTMIYNHAIDKAKNKSGEAVTEAIFGE